MLMFHVYRKFDREKEWERIASFCYKKHAELFVETLLHVQHQLATYQILDESAILSALE